MQDQEKYKHKVRVSRRNWYIRFFCWAWDTSPDRLDICKLVWGTLGLVLLPLLYLFFALIWVWDKTKVEVSRKGRVRALFMEFYQVKYTTDVPAIVYGGGVVLMAFLVVVFSPIIAVVFGFHAVRDRIRSWRLRRKQTRPPRRIMTERNLERITGRASETTARRVNLIKVIWFALPAPVRKVLSIARLPVVAVKVTVKGVWSALKFVWTRGIARVPLWIYGIVGLLGVSITLAAVFDVPVVLAIIVAFGTVALIGLVIRLSSKYRVVARIKEGGKTFGRTVASFGRSVKYNTCPKIVVTD